MRMIKKISILDIFTFGLFLPWVAYIMWFVLCKFLSIIVNSGKAVYLHQTIGIFGTNFFLGKDFLFFSMTLWLLITVLNIVTLSDRFNHILNPIKLILLFLILRLSYFANSTFSFLCAPVFINEALYLFVSSFISFNNVFSLFVSLNYNDRFFLAESSIWMYMFIYIPICDHRKAMILFLIFSLIEKGICAMVMNFLNLKKILNDTKDKYVVFQTHDLLFEPFLRINGIKKGNIEGKMDVPCSNQVVFSKYAYVREHKLETSMSTFMSYEMYRLFQKIKYKKNVFYIPVIVDNFSNSNINALSNTQLNYISDFIVKANNEGKIKKIYFDSDDTGSGKMSPLIKNEMIRVFETGDIPSEIEEDLYYQTYNQIRKKIVSLRENGLIKMHASIQSIVTDFNYVTLLHASISLADYLTHYLYFYYCEDLQLNEGFAYRTSDALEFFRKNKSELLKNKPKYSNNKIKKIFKYINPKTSRVFDTVLDDLWAIYEIRNKAVRHGLLSSYVIESIAVNVFETVEEMYYYFSAELKDSSRIDKKYFAINTNILPWHVTENEQDALLNIAEPAQDNSAYYKYEYIDYMTKSYWGFMDREGKKNMYTFIGRND